jgi:glycosyltransferase involved in cell wall biosynthesis
MRPYCGEDEVAERAFGKERGGASDAESATPANLSSISAFFPCYNDAQTITGLVRSVEAALKLATDDYEVVVVNDASTDDSASVLAGLQKELPCLRVVQHETNRGYGGALRSGFAAATKDYIFYTDGDGQYDPLELTFLAKEMVPGVDVVNGYKISRQDPWYRQVIGSFYQHVTRRLFSFPIRDVDCDFRLLRRSVFDYIDLESNDGAICIELVRKLSDSGFRMVEVPVHHFARAYGTSQFFRPKRIARALRGVAKWYVCLVLLHQQKRRASELRAAPAGLEPD